MHGVKKDLVGLNLESDSGKPKEYTIPGVTDKAKKIYKFEIKNSKGKGIFFG